MITAPELSRSGAANAYDAIRRIRPEMLRSRDAGGLMFFQPRSPLVAVDDSLVGGLEVLRGMPVGEVARIEYLNASKTARLYGLESRDGILVVNRGTETAPALSQR